MDEGGRRKLAAFVLAGAGFEWQQHFGAGDGGLGRAGGQHGQDHQGKGSSDTHGPDPRGDIWHKQMRRLVAGVNDSVKT